MPIQNYHTQLDALYNKYNINVKDLIAAVEARTESFPAQIWNEIRAFNDHVARCYFPEITDADIQQQINRADGHLVRIILDCYKLLIFLLHRKYVSWFGIKYWLVNLERVNDGKFIAEYERLRREALRLKELAKKNESRNKTLAIQHFEEALQCYIDLEQLVSNHRRGLYLAAGSLLIKSIKTLILLVGGIIIGSLIRFEVLTGTISTLIQSNCEWLSSYLDK